MTTMNKKTMAGALLLWAGVLHAAPPTPGETGPGFRRHEMSGVAAAPRIPDRWSARSCVKWAVPVAGRGWPCPLSRRHDPRHVGMSQGRFKDPTPGLYGNEDIAEMQAEGLSHEEVMKRAQARDKELTAEVDEIRYMVYAL